MLQDHVFNETNNQILRNALAYDIKPVDKNAWNVSYKKSPKIKKISDFKVNKSR